MGMTDTPGKGLEKHDLEYVTLSSLEINGAIRLADDGN